MQIYYDSKHSKKVLTLGNHMQNCLPLAEESSEGASAESRGSLASTITLWIYLSSFSKETGKYQPILLAATQQAEPKYHIH